MLELVVVGLGYVGLPLVREAVRSGHHVSGLDSDPAVVAGLASGRSHVDDVSDADVAAMLAGGFVPSVDPAVLDVADVVVICVPTPLDLHGSPDLSAVLAAGRTVAEHLRPGVLVVLESTSYPGTTDDLLRPLLEESGLVVGTDLHLAFSPERIDPGNPQFDLRRTPKVVGGVTPECGRRAGDFYRTVVDEVVMVPRAREAELTKLLENTFRHVNIALVNEMVRFSHQLGIDLWDAIDCAATKPFGYMAFRPGPGVGGHCIPVDPSYLSHRVKAQLGYAFRMVELAEEINTAAPLYVANRVWQALNERRIAVNGARVLLLGVTYKANISDRRESPADPLAKQLLEWGAEVSYHDPFVPEWEIKASNGVRLQSLPDALSAAQEAQIVVLLQAHSSYDLDDLPDHSRIFLDTRGASRNPRTIRL